MAPAVRRSSSAAGDPPGAARVTLRPTAPFDFHLTAGIFAGGDKQIRFYDQGVFRQVVAPGGRPLLTEIAGAGTVGDPRLSVRVRGEGTVSRSEAAAAGKLAALVLNARWDPAPFRRAAARDRVLAALARRLRGLRSPVTPTVFEALVCSVVEQQISLAAARAVQNRLIRRFGARLAVDGAVWFAFPSPPALARAALRDLRACGLSAAKAACIRRAAAAVTGGAMALEGFRKRGDIDRQMESLTALRGVGRWTAELTLLRGVPRYEVIPAADLGLRRDFARCYHRADPVPEAEVRRLSDGWGRWKGLGAFYMMTAGRLGLCRLPFPR